MPFVKVEWQYASGYIISRMGGEPVLTIVLHSRKTNLIAQMCYANNEWSDWDFYVKNSDLYTKIVDANFVNGEVSITINDIDVTKYSWSAVGRTGMTIITSILPENTNTLKLTARGWWDSTVSEGATRNIQLIGVKISS